MKTLIDKKWITSKHVRFKRKFKKNSEFLHPLFPLWLAESSFAPFINNNVSPAYDSQLFELQDRKLCLNMIILG